MSTFGKQSTHSRSIMCRRTADKEPKGFGSLDSKLPRSQSNQPFMRCNRTMDRTEAPSHATGHTGSAARYQRTTSEVHVLNEWDQKGVRQMVLKWLTAVSPCVFKNPGEGRLSIRGKTTEDRVLH